MTDIASKVLYAADIVLVIDTTASMGPFIEDTKKLAMGFHERISREMRAKGKTVDQLRVRLIVFRDYYDKEENAIVATPFWKMPEEEGKLVEFVSMLQAGGGGDEPENGLEALALAIRSSWEQGQGFQKCRHSIVVFTDASAHPLEHPGKPPSYPKDMPKDLNELTDMWFAEMRNTAKRLTIFAPDVPPWNIFEGAWDCTQHHKSHAGSGLDEQTLSDLVEGITNSIT
ncbi:vWA domain-containing protein [Calothrix sp. 336/3]|uniref:vWA domain-containing protein n=1 Tax=Calothrix sp. 336/3 TaxID=1337936 RepID=UPI0004E38DF2|nr:vWA domain-containing protein [Calothrix sp. 336/3]AKG24895.1 hypothetical protein IJ00_26470 [Calothrix sp. 336/3]